VLRASVKRTRAFNDLSIMLRNAYINVYSTHATDLLEYGSETAGDTYKNEIINIIILLD